MNINLFDTHAFYKLIKHTNTLKICVKIYLQILVHFYFVYTIYNLGYTCINAYNNL